LDVAMQGTQHASSKQWKQQRKIKHKKKTQYISLQVGVVIVLQ